MDQENTSPGGEHSQEDYWRAAQEMMAAGEDAARLLNSPVFNIAYRALMEDTINQWLTSEPKETNKRDSLYYQARAQTEMATRMQSFVEQAETLRAAQDTQQSAEHKQAEYLNNQGFTRQ